MLVDILRRVNSPGRTYGGKITQTMPKRALLIGLAGGAAALLLAGVLAVGPRRRPIPAPPLPEDYLAPAPGVGVSVRPGHELRYLVQLAGAPLGVIVLTGEPADNSSAAISYRLQTLPALSRIWEFEATGATVVDAVTLLPLRAESRARDKDGVTVRTSRFRPAGGGVYVTRQRPGQEEPDREFVRARRATDPLAALLMLGAARESGRLTVLRGADVYHVRAEPAGLEEVSLPAGGFRARRWELGLRAWDEDEGLAEAEYELTAWVDGQTGLPLQLEAPLPLGSLTARLTVLSEPEPVP